MSEPRLDPQEFIEIAEKLIPEVNDEATIRRIMSSSYFVAMLFAMEYSSEKYGQTLEEVSKEYIEKRQIDSEPSSHEGFRFLIAKSSDFDREDKMKIDFLFESRVAADYHLKSYSPSKTRKGKRDYVKCSLNESENALNKCKKVVEKIRNNFPN